MTIFKKKLVKAPLDKDKVAIDILTYLRNDFSCAVLFSIFDRYVATDAENCNYGDIIVSRDITREVNININHYNSTQPKHFQQVFVIKIADESEEILEPDPNFIMNVTAFIVVSSLEQLEYRLESFER